MTQLLKKNDNMQGRVNVTFVRDIKLKRKLWNK